MASVGRCWWWLTKALTACPPPLASPLFPVSHLTSTSAGQLAPARELGGDGQAGTSGTDNLEDRIMYFLTNLNLVVPVVAALAVIIIAIIVICVLKGKSNNNISKG
jgi:hypothetical protein